MKFSKVKIILLTITGLILLGIGGAIYYASTQINPEEIRKLALDQISEEFPNAETELGKLDFSLGLSIGFELDSLKMKLKKSKGGHELVAIKNLNVDIPLWSILMGGGTINLDLDKPYLNYVEGKKGNNWQAALPTKRQKAKIERLKKASKKKPLEKKTVKKVEKEHSILIPALVSQSKINVKFKDVNINYQLKDKSKGSLVLNKFLIKNLNFKTESAFELDSKINYVMPTKEKLSFKALLIGHFNLKNYIETKDLKSLVILTLEDFSMSGSKIKIPNLKTDLTVLLKANGDLNGSVKTLFDGGDTLKTDYSVNKSGIYLKNLNISIAIKRLLKIVGEKIDAIYPGESNFNISGKVDISKRKGINPSIEYEITKGFSLQSQGQYMPTTLKGNIRGQAYNINAMSKFFGGVVTTNVATRFNLNKIETEISKLAPINIRVGVRDIVLPKPFIQAALYPENKTENTVNSNTQGNKSSVTKKGKANSKMVKTPAPILPTFRLNLDWVNVDVAKNIFSGKSSILVQGNSIVTKSLDFNFSKGKGKVIHSTNLLANGATSSKLDVSLKALNLDSFRAFLPPKMIGNIKGTFSGTIKGTASSFAKRAPKYDLVTNLKATNGELVGVNISEHVNSIVSSIPLVKNKFKKDKNYKIDGTFEKLTFKGRLKDTHYNLKNYYFLGVDKKVEIKGNGNLYPVSKTKKGELLLSFIDNTGKISAPMIKHVGTKVLPVKMKGFGFALKPDYGYTIKKIGKSAYKKKGKKAVKKQVEKLKNKYLKGENKKKINKLLKGLFK
jgi:hypothetical protein